MSDFLKTVAKSIPIKTGVEQPKQVGRELALILGETYRLLLKTHAYHWNVNGPLFMAIHQLTEGQYQNLFEATDLLAERIRALGQLAPMTPKAIVSPLEADKDHANFSAHDMVSDLIEDHQTIAKDLHTLIALATKNNDPVTADLATGRSAFHEKAIWMLKALLCA